VLQFGRDICGNLPNAEGREWLVTNGIGGYACGTIAGLLTRHYHGLLVAALKPPVDRTLLLTKLDEQVNYAGQVYTLHCDRWADGILNPEGYCLLERFTLDGTIPTWTFALGDALLEKRIWMEQGANTTYIHYELKRGSAPVKLAVKALVNYRQHHASTYAKDWHMQIQPIDQGVAVTAFDGATPLYVFSNGGLCTPHHDWYRNYDLAVENYRGIDPHDDHLHAATIAVQLSPGQSLMITASTEAPATVAMEGAMERQKSHEQALLERWAEVRPQPFSPQWAWLDRLVLAADQFIVKRPIAGESDGRTVIAGYPWFGDWGRDTMIALPGLTIATGRPDIARPILRTFARYVDQGMLPNLFPEEGQTPEYNTVDATLWYFEAIRAYYAATQDDELLRELFPVLAEIIRWHQTGTRYNIHQDSDGLIYAGEPGIQLTWMDAKVDDWVVTPRIGKPIEVNALWYNALLIMAQFAEKLGVAGAEYRLLADQTRKGFQRFWYADGGYCYDFLDGPEGEEDAFRPNQIFAVALPALDWRLGERSSRKAPLGPDLLSHAQQKAVVDRVARQLLTSHGLRSLAPDHPDYKGQYKGDRYERDGCYHQGTVWGWLMRPFVQAHLRVYQKPTLAKSFLEPMADHLRDGCIGNLSEIFDGDAPMTPRGAFAQAWTVAEVLRVWCLLCYSH
jgi:predicted glycogen debranching enzyme